MKVLAAVAVAVAATAGVAEAFSSAKMCCLINQYRATKGLKALGHATCADPISNDSAQQQANRQNQGHYLSNPLGDFSRYCRTGARNWVECAAGAPIWKNEADAVNAWAAHYEHDILLRDTSITVCSAGGVTGRNGVLYFSFDGWNAPGNYPDPCAEIGQGTPDRQPHSNPPPVQQPAKPAPQPAKPAPAPQQPQRQAHNNQPAPAPAKPVAPAPAPAPAPKPTTSYVQPPAPKPTTTYVPPPAYTPPAQPAPTCCAANCCPVAPTLGKY
ncbi:hypothetical protein GQ42DRAFT_160023 [Ramicandelaber brevisporus]|nr:hypothetical protein GQ42DRAFT_160023 [Ramicandelaber brevisporus]